MNRSETGRDRGTTNGDVTVFAGPLIKMEGPQIEMLL